MSTLQFIQVVALAALMASQQNVTKEPLSHHPKPVPPASCPVTPRPATPFVPPATYSIQIPASDFWIGTDKLWTNIGDSMVWQWRPRQPGHEQDLTAKTFWFRVGYDYRTEPVPKLRVTGTRLDGPAPPLVKPQGEATNAILGRTPSMLTGVYVPTPGCWKITGDYQGDKLSFVVWVEPARQ